MTFKLLPNDIILDDSNFLRLAFDGYVMSGEGLSERAHFDVGKALEVLKQDPSLGARLLGLAPGNGSIFYTGEMASDRIGGESVGVRVVSRRSGDEIAGDNKLGQFLMKVRYAYREYLQANIVAEEPVRDGQVIADFTRKGAFMSDIEAREEAGERFIHVDAYRPARFRFDAARNGTTGHASRRSDEDVPFHRFVCPFGTAYPSAVIVGSSAEASFLYEKAIRGELDWNALFDDLSNRGLMKKDVSERQKASLIADYKAQFAWMREQICKDSSLKNLPIVSSGILVPDSSLGRSVYDAELAPSPAHVLARYINNPVLLFSPAENAVFRSFSTVEKNELQSFRVSLPEGEKGGSVNILVIGSDVIGGREPGRKATSETVRKKVKTEDGRDVWVMTREPRIPMKSTAEIEQDFQEFAERMDSVLASIPAGVKVNLITGSASTMGDTMGVGTAKMVYRYALERGGQVMNWDFNNNRRTLKDGPKEAPGDVVAVMMDHFADCLPVLSGYEEEVSFPLHRDVDDVVGQFAAGSGLVSDAAVCFTMHDDTNTRNVLSMGSYVAAAGLPVIHVMDNCSEEKQAAMLSSGSQLARASLSGESTEGGHALEGVVSREWQAPEVNVLSYVDRELGVAHPFVLNSYPGSTVVAGQSFHSALGTYVALVAEALGKGDRQTLLGIGRAEGSLRDLMGIYRSVAVADGKRLDDSVMESCLRRSVRMMSLADSGFAQRLLDIDGKDIVMPVSLDDSGSGLFTDLDLKGENRFGIILTDERARLVTAREERRKAAEAERQAIVEEAARRQKLVVGNRAEGQKVQGGFPAEVPGKIDSVWFLGTNTPDQFMLPDGEHSFDMWDDMDGDDPLVREKAVRPYVDDGDGGKVPNTFVYLFPSDLSAVTGKGTVPRNPDSRDLTGVMRKDRDGNMFVCAYGIPVRVNKSGYEIVNDDNLPCSYRLDNDAANFAESLVLADSAARSSAIRHDMTLMLPGRTRRDGSEYFTLGQVFMDKIYDREEHKFVKNPHRAPLNYDLTERYINLLQRGKSFPLNYIAMPQAEYPLEGSAEEVEQAKAEAHAEDKPYISSEGRFISDLLLSLRIANSLAVSLNVPLRFPLDEKGRIDLGPGVPEQYRALAERRIDSFIGVVKEEDIIGTKLPMLERIPLFDALKSSESLQKGKDLYIRPNELVYAFGGYDFTDILSSRNVPLHEMAFKMEDGTVFMLSDAKMTRGMDAEDVNKYLCYEKNDERRFVVRTTNIDKAGEFISLLQSYCERAKAVRVEARLFSMKEAEKENKALADKFSEGVREEGESDSLSMEGYVKLFSSNSEQFATNEHEIGRTQTIYNSTSRFDNFDAEEVYWGKVDAKDGFEGYAQLRYILPDGKQSGWFTVRNLDLAKDMVMSMVNRSYRDGSVVPSAAVMKMLMTAEAVRFSGDEFRNIDFEGHRREVDDKVVVLEGIKMAEPEKPVKTEREDVSVREEATAKAQAAAEAPDIVPSIEFTESAGGYQVRTSENANAPDVDFTLSFAVDFTTYGERSTAKAAGDSLIKIPLPLNRNGAGLDCSPAAIKAAVDTICDMLPDEYLQGEEFGLNIAGNGIYSLAASGVSQKQCDEFVTKTLAGLVRRGAAISSIRTGGQTGIDEAGAVAGCALGVQTTVHAPKEWQFRGVDGQDVKGEKAFKQRFAGKDLASLRAMVSSRRKEQSVKNVISK